MKLFAAVLLTIFFATFGGAAEAAAVLNNLQQIAIAAHDDGQNSLKQIAIGVLGAGSYVAGDGSVTPLPDDGSVRYISVGSYARASFCFRNVTVPGGITDGTSNTIVFNENAALAVTPGFHSGPAPQIIDGTSNTILVGEGAPDALCLGDATVDEPLPGNIVDGTSNTIVFGENSNFDMCFSRAATGSIVDGTSNTIQFGETRSNVCYWHVVAGPDLAVAAAAEPGTAAVIFAAFAGLALCRRRAAQPGGGKRAIQWRAMSSRRQIQTRSWPLMYSMKRIKALARPGWPVSRIWRPIDIIFGRSAPSS